MTAYCNDADRIPCAWLDELEIDGALPGISVDYRPIEAVRLQELDGYAECHFFAGIGGWHAALRLARWPPDAEVWTGSCPCQPFSNAGKRRGTDDPRHVWPAFRALIAERRPATIFGEQVAGKAGRAWLAGVRADLEPLGYAVGAADLPAACVGSPHPRQRLFCMAHAHGDGREWVSKRHGPTDPPGPIRCGGHADRRGELPGALEHANGARREGAARAIPIPAEKPGAARAGFDHRPWDGWTRIVRCLEPIRRGGCRERIRRVSAEPGLFPLTDGFPNRVGALRGAGNAIVPQVAAEFVMSCMETVGVAA